MITSADYLVHRTRRRIHRVQPGELQGVMDAGALAVDIRPAAQREQEGELPRALVIERNVLEWRLDPTGTHRVPEAIGYDRMVVIVCSEGYASSLAAASLADLGYRQPADLAGGYRGWRAWSERAGAQPTREPASSV